MLMTKHYTGPLRLFYTVAVLEHLSADTCSDPDQVSVMFSVVSNM